jgi:succinoglycan biosynthesis protein ExoM
MDHVSVCICTYKRPKFLTRLLAGVCTQETGGLFTHSVVVVDNDRLESARQVVADWSARSGLAITYCVEPRQSIALARNKAVENARGGFVAFIDDDEFPDKRWLLTLFEACQAYHVDGVLGPVTPHYASTPPAWVVKGKFYDRPVYPTGLVVEWTKGRTGNVLLRSHVFSPGDPPFRPEFLTGEDQDFFRRMIGRGFRFIWCEEARAYEEVPPARWNRRFMLKRALLRGSVSIAHPTIGVMEVARSAVAITVYLAILPFSLVLGQRGFMDCLIRLCDHIGRVLAFMGVTVVKEQYVTE